MSKLNLGSGVDYRDGWVNVDYNDKYNPDMVYNLNDEWPAYWYGSFEYVLASHIFEHLDSIHHAFIESAKCLKIGGTLEVRVPFGINAKTDMTHKHFFTYDSALQFAHNIEHGYQFDPPTPLHLIDREVNIHIHSESWLAIFGHLIQYFVNSYPGLWVEDIPFSSGEYIFTYRRVNE